MALRCLDVVVLISGFLADIGFWCCLEVDYAGLRASGFTYQKKKEKRNERVSGFGSAVLGTLFVVILYDQH